MAIDKVTGGDMLLSSTPPPCCAILNRREQQVKELLHEILKKAEFDSRISCSKDMREDAVGGSKEQDDKRDAATQVILVVDPAPPAFSFRQARTLVGEAAFSTVKTHLTDAESLKAPFDVIRSCLPRFLAEAEEQELDERIFEGVESRLASIENRTLLGDFFRAEYPGSEYNPDPDPNPNPDPGTKMDIDDGRRRRRRRRRVIK
jgi:hypothetical protein